MASDTLITTQRSPEVRQKASEIEIPNLWAVAEFIRTGPDLSKTAEYNEMITKAMVDIWHLAHSLKKHIVNS